jgi:serine protease
MGRCGTIVTCSAGNDATDRPMFPAAFAPWQGGGGPVNLVADAIPIVAARALNPNGSTVALFSNDGPWIGFSAPGGAVFSTMPAFNGGDQPLARVESAFGGIIRIRESVDPDDFRGGFAVWSGTSFAAPLIAGAVASALDAASLQPFGSVSLADRVKVGLAALQKVTDAAP